MIKKTLNFCVIYQSLMSKTPLSRIKPLHHPKPTSSSSSRIPSTAHVKNLVEDTIQIIKNDPLWQESLEIHFSETETQVSEIAHFVFDQIHDPWLGLEFFKWVSKKSDCGNSFNGFDCSSLLKLLAIFRLLIETEHLLKKMKSMDLTPTCEALSTVIHSYADSALVNEALELYHTVIDVHNCVPDVFACNSLLNVLAHHCKIDIARKLYDEMTDRDGDVDNYTVCIILRGLCKEGKVEEGRNLMEERWGKGCVPNIVFYNTLIYGCCKKGDIERANLLFKELKMNGFLPTIMTYDAMINGFCKEGKFEAVDEWTLQEREASCGQATACRDA